MSFMIKFYAPCSKQLDIVAIACDIYNWEIIFYHFKKIINIQIPILVLVDLS